MAASITTGGTAGAPASMLAGNAQKSVPPSASTLPPRRGQLLQLWDAFSRQQAARRALMTLGFVAAACILLPMVLPWEADQIDNSLIRATGPSLAHPLGTDVLGRDQLARLMEAGRISLMIGFVVAIVSSTVGALFGVVAGYFGGRVELLMMSFVDILLTIPPLPLLMALAALVASPHSGLGAALRSLPVVWRIVFIMVILGWMGIARIVRSQVVSIKHQEYVEAANAFGASPLRIMFIHILPNTISSVAIFTTFAVSGAILGESGLSFLGLGVRPPTPTLGNMIGEASNVFTMLHYWWLTWTPALAILIVVLCVNFIGEGLRASFEKGGR